MISVLVQRLGPWKRRNSAWSLWEVDWQEYLLRAFFCREGKCSDIGGKRRAWRTRYGMCMGLLLGQWSLKAILCETSLVD
ncbi:unnamed protein product [Calypogeia fissa]